MMALISHIVCGDRIRSANPVTVAALAASIKEVGLLNPLTVGRLPVVRNGRAQDGYMLIGGLHRYEAVKSLGWNEVDITVTDLTGPAAVIAECDENLCGTNLTAAERALFTRRRKVAYEALHPETRAHVAGGLARQGAASDKLSFAADTAVKTGVDRRTVERDSRRGSNVSPEVLTQIAGTKLDTGRTLDELASVPKDSQQTRLDELRTAKAARLLTEEQAKEVRKTNSAADAIIKDRRVDAAKEYLAGRLDIDELHQFGEMIIDLCPLLARACMREAA